MNNELEQEIPMQEQETINVNDTMRSIRDLIAYIENWRKDNPYADPRHTAMVITKLEEAELLAQRMVNREPSK